MSAAPSGGARALQTLPVLPPLPGPGAPSLTLQRLSSGPCNLIKDQSQIIIAGLAEFGPLAIIFANPSNSLAATCMQRNGARGNINKITASF